jgi:hypothetical protein
MNYTTSYPQHKLNTRKLKVSTKIPHKVFKKFNSKAQ